MKGVVSSFFCSCLFFSLLYGEGDFLFEKEMFLIPSLEQMKQKRLSGRLALKKVKNIRSKGSRTGMIQHGHVQDPSLEWDWGFRTAIGYDNLPENWNVAATHTQFHTRSFASTKTTNGVLLPTWKESKSLDEEGNSPSWLLRLELADLEVGKDIRAAQKLIVRPHLGVRGALIYQKCQLPPGQSAMEEKPRFLSNNCIGIGLRSGVDSLWSFRKGISFFGDGALSLLSGYYNIDKQRVFSKNAQSTELAPAAGITMGEVSFGMQYERSILQRQMFTFRLGYEMNYVFNRMSWLNGFSHDKKDSPQDGGGIPLQGVTLGFRLDF